MNQPAFGIDPEPAFASVLCGIDDSRPSAEAGRQATVLATPGGSVEFIGVCWTVGEGRQKMSSLNVERVEEALEEAGRAAIGGGVSATWNLIRHPDPVETLLEQAHGHDLVAVGSHTGSRASGILFGSTASTLVHRADLPVLIARRPPGDNPFPDKIVFATDGSAGSAVAAGMAGRICRACGSDLTVVHVDDGETPQTRGELARQTVELREMIGREATFSEASGDPHDVIPRLAAEIGAGLVVIGSRGLGSLKALGSVSERVAQRASCSVLVARPSA
jgi:nucleotide-binding universal stress UspA family protein